jgi:hypothetical protein
MINLTLPKDLTFPAGDFTCKDFLIINAVDIVRITQIKAQRKLNALAAKGTICKNPVKRGLETVYCLVEDAKVNGSAESALAPTPQGRFYFADDVKQDGINIPKVTYGQLTTIRVGGEDAVAANGDIVTVTKEQKYPSSASCRYAIRVNGTLTGAYYYNIKAMTQAVIAVFKATES